MATIDYTSIDISAIDADSPMNLTLFRSAISMNWTTYGDAQIVGYGLTDSLVFKGPNSGDPKLLLEQQAHRVGLRVEDLDKPVIAAFWARIEK